LEITGGNAMIRLNAYRSRPAISIFLRLVCVDTVSDCNGQTDGRTFQQWLRPCLAVCHAVAPMTYT